MHFSDSLVAVSVPTAPSDPAASVVPAPSETVPVLNAADQAAAVAAAAAQAAAPPGIAQYLTPKNLMLAGIAYLVLFKR